MWPKNISFKKETEKIVLLQLKGVIQIIVKFRTDKKYLCMFLSFIKHKHPIECF